MTEFLHEVVAKRHLNEVQDFWSSIERVRPAQVNAEAVESLIEWLIEQQREEDNADV